MSLTRTFVASCLVGVAFFTLAGCSSSGPAEPSIQPAKTYGLDDFTIGSKLRAGKPARLSFAITQPSGAVLTGYRRGPGPHTGVHLILVRSDLGVLIHRHPPITQDGRIAETSNFPTPGRYRLVVDAYPARGGQRNLQFFRWITVPGTAPKDTLPPPATSAVVDGYRFAIHGRPRLHAIQAALLEISVTRPDGTPATFTPYYGALAHAIFFREKTLDYFHTHVCSPGATGCTSILGATKVTGRSSAPGKLTVGVLVPVSGTWRLFLQTKVDGRILTAPFTLEVR
jgi:hypothetical protein